MWPINYEDFKKLHMSIGAGLLVAAFVLMIQTFEVNYNFDLDKYADDIKEDQAFIHTLNISENSSIQLIQDINEIRKIELNMTVLQLKATADRIQTEIDLSKMLFIIGIVFFMMGYLPFLYQQLHRN